MVKSLIRNRTPAEAAPFTPYKEKDIEMLVVSSLRKLAALFNDEPQPGCSGSGENGTYDPDLDTEEIYIGNDTDTPTNGADSFTNNTENVGFSEEHGANQNTEDGSLADERDTDITGDDSVVDEAHDATGSIDASFDTSPSVDMVEGTPIELTI
ncbi:hypothetical protein BGW38_008864 [Lunasporangiospora selenospora]|uniref:Uncharacterized protein n=1 Tax=Lunasporangiospora selenospora TaxID=979761 RepID=A0A9P6FYA5_9FUNG|nr:hypothetical protein BGW38_008864 [Lunasporangiospora selenospora]